MMNLFKWALLLVIPLAIGCKSKSADNGQEKQSRLPFSKDQWLVKNGGNYVHREAMLDDLMTNHTLHGLSLDSLVLLLGTPDRKNGEYLYYTIDRDQLGILTLHTITLVIKLNSDSTVEWRKIHQ